MEILRPTVLSKLDHVHTNMQITSISYSSKSKTDLIPITAVHRYFLVVNAIAGSYAAGSLFYSVAAGRCFKHDAALVLSILDLIILALLFSANGAAAAVGLIGRDGNSHVQWRKVCDVFDGYCHHMAAALVLSLMGCFAFLWLALLAVLGLRKK